MNDQRKGGMLPSEPKNQQVRGRGGEDQPFGSTSKPMIDERKHGEQGLSGQDKSQGDLVDEKADHKTPGINQQEEAAKDQVQSPGQPAGGE